MQTTLIRCVASLALASACAFLHAQSSSEIDPMLGADKGGNVFVGPTLPFGMAKPGPDYGTNESNAGWEPTGDLHGFSQLHVSGTGGGPKYGNILIQPQSGPADPTHASSPRAAEHAEVGYYSVTLANSGIRAEITTARRTPIYRFTFPADKDRTVLLDVGHMLMKIHDSPHRYNEGQVLYATDIRVVSPTEIAGVQQSVMGWNIQTVPMRVFFYLIADTPSITSGTWQDGKAPVAGAKQARYSMPYTLVTMPHPAPFVSTGAYLTFAPDTKPVTVKIGLSFISIEQAKQNALSEIAGFDFDTTRKAVVTTWNDALKTIQIKGGTADERQQFATGLYHSMLMPVDRTGENPLWQSAAPTYDDFYCIWDTFRSSSPLLTLIAPRRQTAILQSLLDIQDHDGFFLDGRAGNYAGRTQGGSNAEMMFTDAYVKHLPGLDWERVYKALRHDATADSPEPMRFGRGDMADYTSLGYLSIENSDQAGGPDRPGSRSMEYYANDYAVALMARGLGHTADEKLFLDRSSNWKKLWRTDAVDHTEDGDITGFIWMRHADGSWKEPFNPHLVGTWYQDNFYEAGTWTYSLYVPQDTRSLIAQIGGKDLFKKRLDLFFAPVFNPDSPHARYRYDVGNEPGFLSPYLYNWIGEQSSSAKTIRAILPASYHTGTGGLPGNDDSGAMGSFLVFNQLGFFPVAAQNVYLIGSPTFPKSTLILANGRTFSVVAENTSPTNIYIAKTTWNGKPYLRSWFTHDELMAGGELHLTMTDKPTHWDTGAPPPSMSDKP
ncbi:GH92 family glycosyl hydrolase [Edaphobacter flagellatus]|uniref:GH92 family glycosyl hydrolase n=1 Tax=Edaphobacter flagellatus TaxID=1933044 RepID=UPI0021B213C2|nr:GH92 family glycosyl hydrolase [Edaphobacter flagellatus]